jgi:hypothetical protein
VTTIPGFGPQYDQPDARGWLVFHGLPDDVQRAEDATQAADVELANRDCKLWRERPATDTERALLAHLGYELPDELLTRVQWRHGTLRERRWPQLETQTPPAD